eukprot:1148363-Pelagomonas_calceolata.AAC.1
MFFILDVIISLTKILVWGRLVIPSCCLKAKGVNTDSKSSHAANDTMWEVKEHILKEDTELVCTPMWPPSRKVSLIDVRSVSLPALDKVKSKGDI